MLRVLAIAAMVAFALPTLATAQEHHDEHGPPPHAGGPPHPPPHPAGPPPHGPPMRPVPGPHGPMGGPPHGPGPAFAHPGGPGPGAGRFSFHGHDFARVHVRPFLYPHGWAYRQWAVGAVLPPLFLTPDYFYPEWAQLGLEPPPPGAQWVRYGPDLLLVDTVTGQVIDTAYGVFYDE
jgi:Nickel/cobalt transporter regulator